MKRATGDHLFEHGHFLSQWPVNYERRFPMLSALRKNGSMIPATTGEPVNRLSSLFDIFFNDDFFALPPTDRGRAGTGGASPIR